MKTAAWITVVCGAALMASLVSPRPDARAPLVASQASDPAPVARADGPFLLDARPARISLAPAISLTPTADHQNGTLANALSALGAGGRLFVVVRGVTADRQPGVLFQLFLDLPDGARPDAGSPHYIGTLNFFRALPAAGQGRAADATFDSYDITATARRLEGLGLLRTVTMIVIAPVGVPDPAARAAIESVALVRQ